MKVSLRSTNRGFHDRLFFFSFRPGSPNLSEGFNVHSLLIIEVEIKFKHVNLGLTKIFKIIKLCSLISIHVDVHCTLCIFKAPSLRIFTFLYALKLTKRIILFLKQVAYTVIHTHRTQTITAHLKKATNNFSFKYLFPGSILLLFS